MFASNLASLLQHNPEELQVGLCPVPAAIATRGRIVGWRETELEFSTRAHPGMSLKHSEHAPLCSTPALRVGAVSKDFEPGQLGDVVEKLNIMVQGGRHVAESVFYHILTRCSPRLLYWTALCGPR